MIILFGIVLKIPVGFGIWLVWWASRAYDEEAEGQAPGEGDEHGFRRWRREPKPPRNPRRGGPHGGPAVTEPPPRTRSDAAHRPARPRASA
jgi:hypothetical protein